MSLRALLVTLFITGVTRALPVSHSECQYERQTYSEGQEIRLPDPCIKCSCHRGSIVCRLRVCAAQPHPPPRGCWLVTRKDECCQKLICAEETGIDLNSGRGGAGIDVKQGCLVNGTVYAEGSAMDSSTHCQYCYCIKGQQHCVTPQCLLTEPGCTPSYSPLDCCPTKYNCNNITLSPSTTTTTIPSLPSGCYVGGKFYPEGEMVKSVPGDCEKCYCLKEQVRCEPVICTLPVDAGCNPVLTPGHCCPTSYNCITSEANEYQTNMPMNNEDEDFEVINNDRYDHQHVYSERSMTDSVIPNSNNKSTIAATEPSTIQNTSKASNKLHTTTDKEFTNPTSFIDSETTTDMGNITTDTTTYIDITTFTDRDTTIDIETTTDLSTTTDVSVTSDVKLTTEIETTTMSNSIFNDTEERRVPSHDDDDVTTVGTTIQTESTVIQSTIKDVNAKQTNVVPNNTSLEKELPAELIARLNSTVDKDEDNYDNYDNVPSLPPSLPNVRIIPFLVEDAVVNKREELAAEEKSNPTNLPHFYDSIQHPNRFSPPAETEGGFLPREPLLDGPFYESKFDTLYHTTGVNAITVDITSEASLQTITEQPKIHDEQNCLHGGHSYRHLELLTEPNACELCMCYFGEVVCQEPKCPPIDNGCHRLLEKEIGTCCGKIICGPTLESPTKVIDHDVLVPPALEHPAPFPSFTVAHDVVTHQDPFRDVIRTEPAPNLPALFGELMPYLWDHSTTNAQSYYSLHPITTAISITTEIANETDVEPTMTPSTLMVKLNETSNTTELPQINEKENMNIEVLTNTTAINKTTLSNPSVWEEEEEETITSPENEETSHNEDDDDSFSLHSVFDYLFNNEPIATKKPKIKQSNKTNVALLDIKEINDTVLPNTINIKNNKEEMLENRSDDDTNLILNHGNASSEYPLLNASTGQGYLDDNKVVNVDYFEKSTTNLTFNDKSPSGHISHTTMKNFNIRTSTVHNISTKYSIFGTPLRPLLKPNTYQIPPLSVPDPGAASGLLKLAGCNIYGRMYRVGRIISELSGPCMECMCTDVGVQCRALKC